MTTQLDTLTPPINATSVGERKNKGWPLSVIYLVKISNPLLQKYTTHSCRLKPTLKSQVPAFKNKSRKYWVFMTRAPLRRVGEHLFDAVYTCSFSREKTQNCRSIYSSDSRDIFIKLPSIYASEYTLFRMHRNLDCGDLVNPKTCLSRQGSNRGITNSSLAPGVCKTGEQVLCRATGSFRVEWMSRSLYSLKHKNILPLPPLQEIVVFQVI